MVNPLPQDPDAAYPPGMGNGGWRARRRLVAAGVGVVLLIVGGLVWTTVDAHWDGPSGNLTRGNARFFNLPDGGQVATYINHGIAVRWRDAEGNWTDPEAVYEDKDVLPVFQRIHVAGPTLAMFATFTPEDTAFDEDSEENLAADDFTVFVVCRDGSCTASRKYVGALDDPPQVTPDGKHALLAYRNGALITWHGEGILEQHPTGLLDGDYGEHQPLLASDGSLRALHGRPTSRGCSYKLLTTATGEADFTQAAQHIDPGDHRGRCTTSLETFSSDYVVVSRSKYDVWFLARTARTGNMWSVVTGDPSGQVRFSRTGTPKLAGAYERSGYWHWREVVASSPNGRKLVVQVHFPGDERWGPPRAVGHAPVGSQCTEIVPMPTYTHGEEDPFYVSLSCRSRPSPDAAWEYSYPTAVTDDGRHWHTFLATAQGVRVDRDMFFAGRPSYRWTPEAGLRRVDLPVPEGSALTLLSDGTYALSSLVQSRDGCAVKVQLSEASETGWADPVPSTADPLPSQLCSFEYVQGERKNIYHYFGRPPGDYRMIRLAWRDREPVLENGPS